MPKALNFETEAGFECCALPVGLGSSEHAKPPKRGNKKGEASAAEMAAASKQKPSKLVVQLRTKSMREFNNLMQLQSKALNEANRVIALNSALAEGDQTTSTDPSMREINNRLKLVELMSSGSETCDTFLATQKEMWDCIKADPFLKERGFDPDLVQTYGQMKYIRNVTAPLQSTNEAVGDLMDKNKQAIAISRECAQAL